MHTYYFLVGIVRTYHFLVPARVATTFLPVGLCTLLVVPSPRAALFEVEVPPSILIGKYFYRDEHSLSLKFSSCPGALDQHSHANENLQDSHESCNVSGPGFPSSEG